MREVRKTEAYVVHEIAFTMSEEVPEWRFVKRRRQRRLVRQLLEESPVEKAAYVHVESVLNGWALLLVGSFLGCVASLGGLASEVAAFL